MERRAQARIPIDAVVRILEPLTVSADVLEVSLGGFSFRSRSALPPGRPLRFQLQMPGAGTLSGKAFVRWSMDDGLRRTHGLEVVEMAPVARHKLFKKLFPRKADAFDYGEMALRFACVCLAMLIVRELMLHSSFRGFAERNFTELLLLTALGAGAFNILQRR